MPAIDERIKTYSGEAKIENEELNRFQDDAILNSVQGSGLNRDLHYPHIATSDNKLAYTTAPDKVTITGGQVFSVGGIRFNTSDLSNLEQTIPDNFDGYIRVAVAADCGDVVDAGADPIVRKLTVTFSQTTGSESDPEGTGGGPSSPESARLFHVTKGAGGTAPTITAYVNDGHGHVVPDLTAENVSFDNATSGLTATDVQAAIDEVEGRVDTVESDKAEIVWPSAGVTLVSGGTPSTTWTTLTDSGLPNGVTAVLLYAEVSGLIGSNFVYFRKPGTTAEHKVGALSTQVHYASSHLAIVPINTSKQIEYKTNNAAVAVTINRVGYII